MPQRLTHAVAVGLLCVLLTARLGLATEPPPAAKAAPGRAEALQQKLDRARGQLEALGAALFQQGRYDIARAVLAVALELGAEEPKTLFQLGYCASQAGEAKEAADCYGRALAALRAEPEPDRDLMLRCLNNLAVAQRRLGRSEEALKLLQEAVELDARFAPAYFNLGLLYANDLKRPAEAIAAFRKHVANGGARSVSARNMIEKLQQAAAPRPEKPAP